MSNFKHLEVQQRGDITIVHLLTQKLFENVVITELEDELLGYVEQQRPAKLLVNFGPVSHCSTAAINALLRTKNRLTKQGGELRCCGMNPNIRGEFQMLGLDGTIFDIYDSASEAMAEF